MSRRILGLVLAGGLAAATVAMLAAATLARGFDPYQSCDTGLSRLVSCTATWSSMTTSRSRPIFADPSSPAGEAPAGAQPASEPSRVEITSWAVAHCPVNDIARRLLCPAASRAQAGSDDRATGLPLPRPWLVTTAKRSPRVASLHVETPLALPAALGFYRTELGKRGWTEHGDGAADPDRAELAFETPDGPAMLRLAHRDNRTIADLTLRRATAGETGTAPPPGQVRLVLGNATDENVKITIDEQAFELAGRVGLELSDDPDARRRRHAPEIILPPGKHQVTLQLASGAAQSHPLDIAADETWGLLAGRDGLLLPVQLD